MKVLLLGLATALTPWQEPAPPPAEDPTLARQLLADVLAWIREGPPPPEDIQAIVSEAEGSGAAAELVRALGNLGHRLGEVGREEEARALVDWTVVRAHAGGDLATETWALDWLAQEAWSHGELDTAADLLARAVEVDERRSAPQARTRHQADVARIRLTQGRFEEALRAIQLAEESARAAGSSTAGRMVAEVHGSLLFQLGRHREALALCLEQAGEVDPASPRDGTPLDETHVRLEILAADILADVGRLEAALEHARRAHELALDPAVIRVAPLLQLEAKLSLGLLLGDLGHGDEALARLDEAAAEFERLGDARGAAWAAKNRGFALFAAGRWSESQPAFEAAWKAGAELAVPFLEGVAALGLAEALVLGAQGSLGTLNMDEARASAALAVAERVADEQHERTLQWRVAALRGRIHLLHGSYEDALRELRRAVVLVERWRRRLAASGLIEHALRQRSDPYRDAAFAAAKLGRFEEALAFAGLLQARVLDELLTRGEGPLPGLRTPALAALCERIARLEQRVRLGGPEANALAAELQRAEDELDSALLADELAAGRALATEGERVPLERLAAALEERGFDAALVYLVGLDETLVLRLAPGPDLAGRLLPIGRARLEQWIESLRRPLARLEAGELDLAHLAFDVEAARALHDALVQPLGLARDARLALVTDGVLGAIPFELFVTGGEPSAVDFAQPFAHLRALRFLGDEHALASFGSLARLASHPREARAGESVVFLAPTTLGLPHAVVESEAIARALGGARIVPDTTPEIVAAQVRAAARVHFAAHGRIDAERPARGHLVLGGGASGASARLESWQAAELELDGALVVLSACHSGSGSWLAGSGLAGLARGFLLAGAREVVASQWAVDDRVTARFMEHFYAELGRGNATPDALRAARARLRTETDPRGFALAHPAFWAAWSVLR